MATELSPVEAVNIANSAYAMTGGLDIQSAQASVGQSIRQQFDIAKLQRLTGSSGVAGFSATTGFGYVASGLPNTIRSKDVLIVIKGTEGVHDWVTDLHTSGVSGPGGFLVHEGFWHIASGILKQVSSLLSAKQTATVHVVGHSLGGGIANLVAGALQAEGRFIKLYTFASPRVGLSAYAQHLNRSIGRDNIYRVHHLADPVPYVPVFPFCHAPYGSEAYLVRGKFSFVSPTSHKIGSYIGTVADCATWKGLPIIQRPPGIIDQAQELLSEGGVAMAKRGMAMEAMSAFGLWSVLQVLEEVLELTGELGGLAVLGGMTLIDRIVQILMIGVRETIYMAKLVGFLVYSIGNFLGRTFVTGAKITAEFLGWVLEQLFSTIAGMAFRALGIRQAS